MATNSKKFVMLSPNDFAKVIELIDNANNKEIRRMINSAEKSTKNPLGDTEIANAILYDGNIVIEWTL